VETLQVLEKVYMIFQVLQMPIELQVLLLQILASTASHALASSNLNITPENSSAAGHYLLFAQSNTGEAQVKTDSGLTYVPLTDTLTVTKVIGQLEGQLLLQLQHHYY
jgi:hypothetical protein